MTPPEELDLIARTMQNEEYKTLEEIFDKYLHWFYWADLDKFMEVFGGEGEYGLGAHLWRQYTDLYKFDAKRFWGYLDLTNRRAITKDIFGND